MSKVANVVGIDVTNNPVRRLRELGYSVRVTHYRVYVNVDNVLEQLKRPSFNDIRVSFLELANMDADLSMALPRGGRTVVEVVTPTGEEFIGESICSLEDQFCKREGVKRAIGRILKFL